MGDDKYEIDLSLSEDGEGQIKELEKLGVPEEKAMEIYEEVEERVRDVAEDKDDDEEDIEKITNLMIATLIQKFKQDEL